MDLHTVILLPSVFTLLATSTILITLPCIYLLRIDSSKSTDQEEKITENVSSSDNSCEEYTSASSEVEEDCSEEGCSEEDCSEEDCSEEGGSEGDCSDNSDREGSEEYLSYEEALCEISELLSQLGVYTYFTTEYNAPNEKWIKMENENSLVQVMKMVKSKNS